MARQRLANTAWRRTRQARRSHGQRTTQRPATRANVRLRFWAAARHAANRSCTTARHPPPATRQPARRPARAQCGPAMPAPAPAPARHRWPSRHCCLRWHRRLQRPTPSRYRRPRRGGGAPARNGCVESSVRAQPHRCDESQPAPQSPIWPAREPSSPRENGAPPALRRGSTTHCKSAARTPNTRPPSVEKDSPSRHSMPCRGPPHQKVPGPGTAVRTTARDGCNAWPSDQALRQFRPAVAAAAHGRGGLRADPHARRPHCRFGPAPREFRLAAGRCAPAARCAVR